MPRKTKEQIDEKKDIEKKKTTTKKASAKTPGVEKEVKKSTSKKTVSEEKPKTTKKSTSKKAVSEEKPQTTRKSTSKKAVTEEKPQTTRKSTSKKTTTEKEVKVSKEINKKTTSKRKAKNTGLPTSVEYYDLPYKYNKTVVNVLYQNPTTLFVYWEISDSDIENYKKIYGDNFFETTEPVLIVYNDSMNYEFEIVINDFANSWYFNIKDAECNYHVELGRRPKYNRNYENDYIYITSSNNIESPNDRILYNTNSDNSIYFKNTKNNSSRKISLQSLIDQLNLNNKNSGFPLIKNMSDLYESIFASENISNFNALSNPSSGNPSSGSISSRLK